MVCLYTGDTRFHLRGFWPILMDMMLSDAEFDERITRAMDELPQRYITGLDNVVIVMADDPTPEQRTKMQLGEHSLLLGLYEGVPLPERGGAGSMLPDKITLFKNQLLQLAANETELFEQIKRTLWHEMAHYYGLSHEQMDELQRKPKRS